MPCRADESLWISHRQESPTITFLLTPAPLCLWQSDIYADPTCFANRVVNHAVLLVGYHLELDGSSVSSPDSYFILRNSWGPSWGDQGYMYIGMEASPWGYCGLWSQRAYYPVVPGERGKWGFTHRGDQI